MAYNINDWEETILTQIKVAPIMQDGQRIKDIGTTNQTLEVIKQGLNFTNEYCGYYNGSSFLHYMKSDGDAQLQWNYNVQQVVKDTKYNINLDRVNGESILKYHLVLSAANNPSFKVYNSSDTLLATMNLINAGSTNEVNGEVYFTLLNNGTLITAQYSYRKNTVWYHETQNVYLASSIVAKFAMSADSGYTFTSESYVKIINK